MLQYDVKQFLESSSGMKFVYPSVRFTNQKPGAFVSVSYTNQIALFPVRLLFLFCSRVFISRSYENRSINSIEIDPVDGTIQSLNNLGLFFINNFII